MVFASEHKIFIVESYFRTFVIVFSITQNGHTTLLKNVHLFVRVSTKISKFKLKQVYATKNTSMRPEHLNV
jgi:hypothetical protein